MKKSVFLIALTVLIAGCGTAHKAVQTNDDDIVNVGYGTQSRKKVSSYVNSVKAKEKQTSSNIYDYIQQNVPGIVVRQNTAYIQGEAALIFVNGLRTTWGGLDTINPQDVVSVDVIRDATSNIYGMEASRVINIKTKGSF